jgi:DNA-binding transcriptional LysR family regulator
VGRDRQGGGGVELREIEVFLALSEELHFGRTAARLHLSQSRVSQTIQAMESRVGGTLFERSSRRVRLTALGAQLRDGLRPGYEQIQRAVTEARDTARGPSGELRIGLLTLAAGGPMFDALVSGFEVCFPACRVEVLEAFPGKALQRLRTGELDALVHWLPLRQPGVSVGPVLLDAAPALAVQVGHPLAERGWAGLEDLADFAVLDAEGVLPAETLDELMPRFTPAGRPVPRRGREGRMAEVFSLVARGQVVHPTVVSVEDHYSHPAVVLVPLRDAPRRRTALVWMTERANPVLQAFLAFTTAQLPETASDDPATGVPPW